VNGTSATVDEIGVRNARTTPGQVLAIVCAGLVMANLDLFIVNVALPNIRYDFGNPALDDMSLDPERLRHRLCRASRVLRPAGRAPSPGP